MTTYDTRKTLLNPIHLTIELNCAVYSIYKCIYCTVLCCAVCALFPICSVHNIFLTQHTDTAVLHRIEGVVVF